MKLVTGAAGFIGSKVAELLLKAGETVIGLDNLNDYYNPQIKLKRLEALKSSPNFQFHQLDIEDREALRGIFALYDFTAIYNLAARAGVRYSMENPWIYFTTNVNGTLNLLECARNMKSKKTPKFILASSSSLYAGLELPFCEDAPVNTPISQYAASKKSAEVLAYTYHKQYGIDVSVLRYFTVFGPYGRPDMAPYLFSKAILEGKPINLFGDGTQSRDFTFVDDIARGTILSEKKMGYQIINLGGGREPITINHFIELIAKTLNKPATINYLPPHSADMDATMANISKAKQLLGWEPLVEIEDGLKLMLYDLKQFNFKN